MLLMPRSPHIGGSSPLWAYTAAASGWLDIAWQKPGTLLHPRGHFLHGIFSRFFVVFSFLRLCSLSPVAIAFGFVFLKNNENSEKNFVIF
jgi:hypothetical protein